MKKILALVLMMTFLLSSASIACAATDSGLPNLNEDRRAAADQRLENAQAFKTALQAQIDQIIANRSEILKLKAEYIQVRKEALKHVRDLEQNSDLSDEQVQALKDARQNLQEDHLAYTQTVSDMRSAKIKLRAAILSKNVEDAKAALEGMASIQETRIEVLNNLISDLNSILSI